MPKVKRYTTRELAFIAKALSLHVEQQQLAEFFGITHGAMSMLVARHFPNYKAERPKIDLDGLGREYGLISEVRKEELLQQALTHKH